MGWAGFAGVGEFNGLATGTVLQYIRRNRFAHISVGSLWSVMYTAAFQCSICQPRVKLVNYSNARLKYLFHPS
jgi:hypothetical protein